jgi:hypothetical protein
VRQRDAGAVGATAVEPDDRDVDADRRDLDQELSLRGPWNRRLLDGEHLRTALDVEPDRTHVA